MSTSNLNPQQFEDHTADHVRFHKWARSEMDRLGTRTGSGRSFTPEEGHWHARLASAHEWMSDSYSAAAYHAMEGDREHMHYLRTTPLHEELGPNSGLDFRDVLDEYRRSTQ